VRVVLLWRTRRALFEAVSGAVARPVRLLAFALAAGLGIGLYVATLVIASTAERQVAADFDALRAVEVRAQSVAGDPDWVPQDFRERLLNLAGVKDVELIAHFGDTSIAATAPTSALATSALSARVLGVDVGGPRVVKAVIDGSALGRETQMYDTRTALLGARLAKNLGIGQFDGTQAVWVDGEAWVIKGIIRSVQRQSSMLDAFVVTRRQGAEELSGPGDAEIIIETDPGAAQSVADQAPLALSPEDPASVFAAAPPDPGEFRARVESDVRTALLAVSAVVVLVGAITIGNSMALNVVSRTAEIGVRRSLGALRRDVFSQILGEAAIIGFTGGVLGASFGVIGAIVAAQAAGWAPTVDPSVPLQGVAIGTAIGVAAGLIPAIRAARVEPVEALRSSG